MKNTVKMKNTLSAEQEKFEEEFLYWVVLGSTLNDGSELRWNVGDGRLPNIKKIKSFLLASNARIRLQTLQEVQVMIEGEKKECSDCASERDSGEGVCYGYTEHANSAIFALSDKLSALIIKEK